MAPLRLSLFALLTLLSGTAIAGNLTVNLAPTQAVSAGARWRVDGGSWKTSGTTVKNLTNASHTVDYNTISGWIAPGPVTVTLTNNVTTTVTGTYVLPASLAVTLSPSTGQWRVDGGAWRNSGTTATGLTPGAHTVTYNALPNQIAPATESVTLVSGQTTSLTRNYTATSNLTVTLTPSNASWQIDGGAWQPSGSTLSGLTPGAHTISYNALANYIAPVSESVTLVSGQTTNLTRNYTATSNLTITLTPSNASWQIDGGPWQTSGATLSGLTPGAHTISYNALANYIAPATESVTLVSGQTTSLTRDYTATSNLTIALTPSSASWQIDGGPWQTSGATLSGLTPGVHAISYNALANYITPTPENVTLVSGQTTSLSRNYTATSNLTITLTPSNGTWRVDGGAWQPSGTTLSGLTPGVHAISYSALANHIAPGSENVTLVSGQTTSLARTYTETSNLTITLTPSNGTWRVDGGAWQPSGATLSGLTLGAHTVNYSALANYIAPSTETVTLVSGPGTNLTRNYTATSNLTVTLTPSSATWQIDGGPWQPSGATLTELAPGSHSITYSAVANYLTPATESVTLTSGQTTSLTRSYTATSNLTVTLTPSSATWKIDGGPWQPSGATLTGLTPGPHSISYSAVANHITPAVESVTLISGQSTTITRTYTETADLIVNLTPSNASWRVDGGAWQPSGATVPGLMLGAHTISYSALANYITPPSETVTLISGQGLTTLTRSYTATSNLTVTLTPSSGSWRIDGGAWQPSGTTLAGLTPGEHAISYNAVANYLTPAAETVTLISGQSTNLTRSYTATSSLQITLTPSTGWWQIDGAGSWRQSGATVTGLTPGNHTIAYWNVPDTLPPAVETVSLVSGETLSLERSYTSAGQVYVALNPSTAQWRLDGGAWRATNTNSGSIAAGSHTIEYSSLPGMLTPAPQTISVTQGQTFNISKVYARESALIVNLSPVSVGQWRVDGGPWQGSGARVGQLAAGNHAVEYTAAPEGYTAPPSETIFLSTGTDSTIARSYLRPGSVTVIVEPAEGQWRLNNGPWQASGATLGGLRPGNYSVQLSSVPGWFDVPTYGITLAEDEAKTVTYAHLRHATITVNLTPGSAQWRVNGGAWQSSGATVGALFYGNYTIDYSPIEGLTTPITETIHLAAGEQISLTRSYSGSASLTMTLTPSSGTWSVDGGPWRNSGTTASGLAPGAHSISYSWVSYHITLPTETITLGQDEIASLARSYTPGGYIFVTLDPDIAQWRVDGGAWRASSTTSDLLPAGPHTIEYSTVEDYITPAMETVTLPAIDTLAISKTYTADFGAFLEVKTIPAYLSESGAVHWRLDGGDWKPAGAPISVSPGTHNLEFQPVAGLDVPPASSVTISEGATETIEATFYLTHRLRFFLHPDLVAGISTQDLQARLSQYAAHLQTIWHRESLRRFTFNPATDITIVSSTPFSGSGFGPLLEYGFELWAYADSANGSIYGSNGGFATLDVSGAAGADGMHWTQIYDPSTLEPGSTELSEYWKQIDVLTHEFEHVFGAGFGEYYSAAGFDDATGIAPLYSPDYFVPADPFWNAHADFWSDPLLRYAWDNYRLGNPETLPALLDAVHFSATSRGIINGCYRNADTRSTLPDVTRIQISIVDASTGQPIPDASLRIWNRPNPGPTGGQERTVVSTDTPGVFEFDWTPGTASSPLNNWDNGKLLKAFASGYQPKAQWEWIYDAQRVKTVDNSDVWEITVALDPAP